MEIAAVCLGQVCFFVFSLQVVFYEHAVYKVFKIPEQYEKVAILMAPYLNLILYSHF